MVSFKNSGAVFLQRHRGCLFPTYLACRHLIESRTFSTRSSPYTAKEIRVHFSMQRRMWHPQLVIMHTLRTAKGLESRDWATPSIFPWQLSRRAESRLSLVFIRPR